jgi:hypothetical protein
MNTTSDYEARAQQADRLAAKAETDAERRAILEIAELWRKLAAAQDGAAGGTTPPD